MGLESPISVLYNAEGYELALSQSQIITATTQPGMVMAGSGTDGRAYFLRVSNDGSVFITGSITSTSVATQSVWVAAWGENVTGSVKVDAWSANVTGAYKLDAWSPGVTGTVNLVPSASVIVGGWSLATTASTRDIGGSTTNVSAAQASVTNFTFLNANPARMGATFYKEGTNTVYIKFGATATATSYTVKLSNNGYYEMPANYTGRVDILFTTAVVANPLYVTEITTP